MTISFQILGSKSLSSYYEAFLNQCSNSLSSRPSGSLSSGFPMSHSTNHSISFSIVRSYSREPSLYARAEMNAEDTLPGNARRKSAKPSMAATLLLSR